MHYSVLFVLPLLAAAQHVIGENQFEEEQAEEEEMHRPSVGMLQDTQEEEEEEPLAEAMSSMAKWAETMQGFELSDLVTVEIPPRSTAEFFEEVTLLPTTIRGAYFASSRETAEIEVSILDPANIVKFERSGQKEGLFFFEAQYRGGYILTFTNKQVAYIQLMQGLTLTFALRTSNSTDQVLNKEHITPVERGLLDIQTSVKDFQMDQEFAQMRQETHYKSKRQTAVAKANSNLFWFSLMECVSIMGVTSWQVYYIKRLLDNRRVI